MNYLSASSPWVTVSRYGPQPEGARGHQRAGGEAATIPPVGEFVRAGERRVCALCGCPLLGGQRITRIHGSAVHVACRRAS